MDDPRCAHEGWPRAPRAVTPLRPRAVGQPTGARRSGVCRRLPRRTAVGHVPNCRITTDGASRDSSWVPLHLPGLGGGGFADPREVIEAALAHRLKDKAEAAYARGDLFVKRRALMEEWAGVATAKCNQHEIQ